ncbi:MAG: hypothetical protein B6D36_12615 [Planctomycetes bacterium UTPLA1]|jgi:uncharacterized protein (TIGR02001 family)|nr:MAG: hypothetical protein B6D36_12615 [Planctomycetes bacterium UTPLA1]
MRLENIRSLSGIAAVSGGFLLSAPWADAQAQLTGNATVTSEYVWRGSSQTREDPAVQAGVKYAHESGLYASVWGSNVKFRPDNGASSEFDLMLGWNGKIASEWAVDVYLLRYQYPSADVRLNWNEINAGVTWRDNYWLAVGHSNDAMASDTTGTYALLGARYPINEKLRVEGTVARYILDDAFAESYTHGSLGVVWTFKAPFEARLTLHGTDSAAKRLFPGMAGTRAELGIQASF